jgi:hypothetical protein
MRPVSTWFSRDHVPGLPHRPVVGAQPGRTWTNCAIEIIEDISQADGIART